MTKKDSKTTEQTKVEVLSISHDSNKPHRQNVLFIGALVLLVFLSVAWLLIHNVKDSKSPTKTVAIYSETEITKDDVEQLKKDVAAQSTSANQKADSLAQLGGAYSDDGNTNEAILQYEKALAIDPNNKQALTGVLYVYADTKQFDKAITTINVLIRISEGEKTASSQMDVQAYKVQLERLKKGLDI